MGQLGLRRAALRFLSSGLLDARRNARFPAAVENGAGSIYLAGADARRIFDVAICTRMAHAARSHNCRAALCHKSVSPDHRLLPQRLRRTAGQRYAPAGIVGRSAPAARRLARPAFTRCYFRPYLAGELARLGARPLLPDASVLRGVYLPAQHHAIDSRRHFHGWGFWSRRVLYFPCGLRATLGPDSSGSRGPIKPRPKISLHQRNRSRISDFYLESLLRGYGRGAGPLHFVGFGRAASP